jgi:hypothetical protein
VYDEEAEDCLRENLYDLREAQTMTVYEIRPGNVIVILLRIMETQH